ncbi:MAG: tRNA 2-thiouridine(34) synthase MnmA [Phycisphaerae bacterium]|nr:tRNA 2-thiouridine(34) synthase MnmA [Phycisphaerae bacterium]
MKPPEHVVVAMSGGVDSSVAASILVEQGFSVTGLFMRLGHPTVEAAEADGPCGKGCCSAGDAADARFVAGRLEIPFFALNFHDDFDRIIEYFVDEYTQGRTPNPCILCNEFLKFGRLFDYARAIGADAVATGHYARIDATANGANLHRAVDQAKDQSYVLFGLRRDLLGRIRFPIGHLTKDQVRRHAERLGLPVHDKPDSSDICFVPDRDYSRLVRERRPSAFVPGDVVDADDRIVGRHEGIPSYTVGQRRGLGIAMGSPMYVTAIDPEANRITLGPKMALLRAGLIASRVRWLTDEPADVVRADVQIRYAHQATPATVEPLSGNRVCVRFDMPQPAVTPGQAAVFYQGDRVLGGGWIDASLC